MKERLILKVNCYSLLCPTPFSNMLRFPSLVESAEILYDFLVE